MCAKPTFSLNSDHTVYEIANIDRREYGWLIKGLEALRDSLTRADEGVAAIKDGKREEYRAIDELVCRLQFGLEAA